MSERYVLEAEWSGYVERQRRMVHREVITGARIERVKKLRSICFTDGTSLDLIMRRAFPRERVASINGYDRLIREAEATGKSYVTVQELQR